MYMGLTNNEPFKTIQVCRDRRNDIIFQTLFLHGCCGCVDHVQAAFPGGQGADPGLETAVQRHWDNKLASDANFGANIY